LGEKAGQSILDLRITNKNNSNDLSIRDIIEKLRIGELHMEDLAPEHQAMVRKGAMEMKSTRGNRIIAIDGS
jgi:hypothetical protein